MEEQVTSYNFDDTMDYYDSREEYDFVGIIDKEISRRKNKRADEIKDVFKIRPKLPKILDKKRGTGIPSLKGAVCSTSKSKDYLEKIAKKLELDIESNITRTDICDMIQEKMLEKEKYGTSKDGNKFTYIRIPANHPQYPFPYNLEDRIKYITNKIKSTVKHTIDIKISKNTHKTGKNKGFPLYVITINKTQHLDEYIDFLKKLGATLAENVFTIIVE
jgi:hypothetical protein